MASNYPSGLDSLSNPDGGDALSTGHAAQHGNANDAIEAIEGELGTDPAGGSATVKARFDVIEANDWVTTARIGNSQVTSAKIADATITGSDIASGTVTSTNLADGTIVNADINVAAAIDKTKISGTAVTTADTGTVTSTMIADGTITGTDIASGTVTSTNILDATITGTDIASGTVTSTNILDGTIVNADINASAAIDVSKLSGVVTSAGVGNFLTANAASGGDTLGDASGFTTSGVSLARSTSTAVQGSGCIAATVTTTTAWAFYSPTSVGLSAVPVTPGQTYTASVYVKSTTASVGNVSVRIRWFTSAGSTISDSSVIYTVNSSTWTYMLSTAVAPANAAYAAWVFGSPANNLSEVFYLDCLGLWQGAGGLWALPGTPIANLGTYTDESVGRRIFTWDTVHSRWQMTYGDTGWRDVSALLANGWGGTLLVRRHNGRVSWRTGLSAASLDGTSASAVTAFTMSSIDAGFRNDTSGRRTLVYNSSDTTFTVAAIGSDALIMPAYGAGKKYNFVPEAVYTADNAWPASLPGSASGSIPSA